MGCTSTKNKKGVSRKSYVLGHGYYEKEDYYSAVKSFEKAVINDPQFDSALIEKANSLFHLGRHQESLEDYKKALAIDPNQKIAWCNQGFVLNKLEKYNEALESFDKALKIDPNFPVAYKNEAISLFKLGRNDEALEACTKAIILAIDFADAWNLKGIILQELKKYTEAIEAYKTAIDINKMHLEARNRKEECERLFKKQQNVANSTNTEESRDSLRIFEEIDYNSNIIPFKNDDLKDASYLLANYEEKSLKRIGKGGYGIVYLARKKKGGERNIALKVVETSTLEEFKDSIKELMNLENIGDHPNIMKFLNYNLIEKIIGGQKLYQFYIEMVLATNSLENILKKYKSLTEPEIIYITRQLCLGLTFTHDNQLAHSDLKPENILVVNKNFKIADWGGSIKMQSNNTRTIKTHIFCTKGYNAPEIDEGNPEFSNKKNFYISDIYSLAMIILRMCGITEKEIKETPKTKKEFHDMNLKSIFQNIENSYSAPLIQLIKEMSNFVPTERKSLRDIIKFIDGNLCN